VIGMQNRPEVKILSRGPDGGNPTPKRQGLCLGKPGPQRRDANAVAPAKEGPKEVIGAHPFRAQAKRRKASTPGEPASGGTSPISIGGDLGRSDDGMDAKSVSAYPMRSVGSPRKRWPIGRKNEATTWPDRSQMTA
jgi:hypothetical protein